MAGAGSTETRLCIVTGGAFKGWLSGGYLTSCNPPPSLRGTSDGCNGGYADAGYELANAGGIPTGSNDLDPPEGCVPYFGAGDYADHWNSRGGAPECPSACDNAAYTVPLGQDLYFGDGQSDVSSTDVTFAKQELVQHGPIVMSYTVYDDFMSYTSGIYTYRSGPQSGGHAVMCTGYGSQGGTEFLRCTNSWGSSWGEGGTFRIVWGECDMRYYAGYMAAEQPALGGASSTAAPDSPETPAPTPAPTPEPTPEPSEPASPGCCGEPCQLSSDCSAGTFCCPNSYICMDRLTYSTRGPMCRRCSR